MVDPGEGMESMLPNRGYGLPGSRGACHRAALRADPLARPGMTKKPLGSTKLPDVQFFPNFRNFACQRTQITSISILVPSL
jgi:hypothetical protein